MPMPQPSGTTPVELAPLLRLNDVCNVLKCSRRELERMRAAGRLPKPDLHVGVRSPRWLPRTLADWIESQRDSARN